MAFTIKYAALCHRGNFRAINQDNLWCDGFFLDSKNDGLPEMLTGSLESSTFPAFAIFDGMGGEQRGEMAAHKAASNFNKVYNKNEKGNMNAFLLEACSEMNRKILEYQSDNFVKHMGTTAALVLFGKKEVAICNVGDSRIYHLVGNDLIQMSHDHVDMGNTGILPTLSQNLGIPESEFLIEPHIERSLYHDRDRFLLCSDGLTDMLTDTEIRDIVSTESDIEAASNELMKKALERGGTDNITIILCEIHNRSRFSKHNKSSGSRVKS